MELKDKTCLVSGGSGMIGSYIIKSLLEAGARVINLDVVKSQAEHVDNLKIDIRDFQRLNEIFQKRNVDIIFHQAANEDRAKAVKDPAFDFEVNVRGTANLLLLSRDYNVRRFIFASSASVYGNLQYSPVDEEHPTNPVDLFGAGKLAAEKYVNAFHQTYGLKTVILRYFNPYSSKLNQRKLVLGAFLDSLLGNHPPKLYSGGKQKRDFVHVEDVALANILAASSDTACGEAFNIGTGKATCIKELYDMLRDLIGSNLEPAYEPGVSEPYAYVADISKAQKLLGYSPTISLHQGLERLVQDIQRESEE